MISPLAVLAALTMTENGAKGDTLSQMEQVLSDGTPVGQQGRELSSYMKKSSRYRECASEHCKFNLAERCRHLTCGG